MVFSAVIGRVDIAVIYNIVGIVSLRYVARDSSSAIFRWFMVISKEGSKCFNDILNTFYL